MWKLRLVVGQGPLARAHSLGIFTTQPFGGNLAIDRRRPRWFTQQTASGAEAPAPARCGSQCRRPTPASAGGTERLSGTNGVQAVSERRCRSVLGAESRLEAGPIAI